MPINELLLLLIVFIFTYTDLCVNFFVDEFKTEYK